jgi:hypothetical protein
MSGCALSPSNGRSLLRILPRADSTSRDAEHHTRGRVCSPDASTSRFRKVPMKIALSEPKASERFRFTTSVNLANVSSLVHLEVKRDGLSAGWRRARKPVESKRAPGRRAREFPCRGGFFSFHEMLLLAVVKQRPPVQPVLSVLWCRSSFRLMFGEPGNDVRHHRFKASRQIYVE